MNKSKSRSTKIDVQIKLLALDLFKRGSRVSDISKKIGYSEPTIKYWINHSDSIISQEISKMPQITFSNLDEYYSKKQSESNYTSDNIDCEPPAKKKNILMLNNISHNHDNDEYTDDHYESPVSGKETIDFPTSPKVLEFHSTKLQGSNLPNLEQAKNSHNNLNNNDFHNFKSDFKNCQEAIDELVDFISSGKKLLNKASNFLYQLQDTMNRYEIREKVKDESQ